MLKCAIFADFLDFEIGCCYLNTVACKGRKNTWVSCILAEEQTFLLLVLNYQCLKLGWSWEKNYVKMCHFCRFLRF